MKRSGEVIKALTSTDPSVAYMFGIDHDKHETNLRQTIDKPKADRCPSIDPNSPIDNKKSQDKHKTNSRQSSDNVLKMSQDSLKTNLRQDKETIDKPKTQHETSHKTVPRQTIDKPKTKKISMLRGVKLKILRVIFKSCLHKGDKMSYPLSIEYIANEGKINPSSIRKTIARMIDEDGILIRGEFSPGPGGCTEYLIPDHVYSELLTSNTQTENLRQTQDNHKSQPETQPETPVSSSSSLNNNIKTTTISDYNDLPDEWKEIDFELLDIEGFTKTHIVQGFNSGKMAPNDVQDTLNKVSSDAKQGYHFKKSPFHAAMYCIRNGEPYTPAKPYRDDITDMLARKIEYERQKESKRNELEKELHDLSYENWVSGLSMQEITQITNMQPKMGEFSSVAKRLLASYYDIEIWPLKRLEE